MTTLPVAANSVGNRASRMMLSKLHIVALNALEPRYDGHAAP